MAVSNGYWSTGTTTVPNIPQIRPPLSSSSFDFTVAKKSFNLKFVSNSSNVMKSSLPPVNNSCRCSNNFDHATSSDWDWNQWTRHFSEVELAERSVSLLQFQLEEAIEKEDFQEASKLKTAIAEATSKDSVTEIMSELKNAIHEERYQDASKLCKNTGSGLVGWWVGYSKDSDDPFGRLIRITPGVGRFIGKSYNPRQLVSASPGTPLFEIFVVKENDEKYTMQVVFMQRAKLSNVKTTSPSNSSSTKGVPITDIKNAPVIDVKVNEDKPNKNDEKSIKFEGSTEDGIRSVLNYIKDIIPNLKVKEYSVMEVDVEEVMKDNDTVNQLMQEDDEKTTSDEDSEDENTDLDDTQSERIVVGPNSDETDDGKDLEIKFFVGGVLHSRDDTPSKDEFVRVPAEIEEMEKDSFVLHVPVKVHDLDSEESITSKVKIAAIASQGVSELMPPDVAKALWSFDKVSRKVSRDVREIVKFAVNQAKKQEKLSEYTNFSRITATRGDLDPFDGLYVGAFGPYGTEVVQLKRKYGNWSANDVEFFEYVEAVKVTGDLNVPAGQVTFRAKIAKASHFSNRGMYPDELGVVGSYKGQGRIAEFGFKNPKWVEGELLQLNGKGMGPYVKGADLGFLYVVPEQSFLVLFNRLRLPE